MKIYEYYTHLFSKDPVPTEAYAYSILKKTPVSDNINYLAVPWAFLINHNRMMLYRMLFTRRISNGFTICQHVNYEKIIPIIKWLGIDTIFTPHAGTDKCGIRIAPFPHYALNGVGPADKKDIFYSFIGAKPDPKCTHSRIRGMIFNMPHPKSTIIIERKNWHLINYFYPNKISTERLRREKSEYQDALSRSRFSLCPRGVGPGSIRFWESLQAGAIPVLLSDELKLPGGINWEQIILRVEESKVLDVPKIIAGIPGEMEAAMRQGCLETYRKFSGNNFTGCISGYYDKAI